MTKDTNGEGLCSERGDTGCNPLQKKPPVYRFAAAGWNFQPWSGTVYPAGSSPITDAQGSGLKPD